jgi:superfamily II DNA/RNA helicase
VSTPGFAYNILKNIGDEVSVQYLVMDESDMMLDDSFVTEIANIISVVPIKFSENIGGAEGNGLNYLL